mmetsp:Transcript_22994/g.25350  ORF Transcript_22994/g.25350 Transcript_22994/m.25350 type:complete len:176 (+) Transcript_22994:84-611(+)|eukprot:CAMPEP_0194136306 /NCGR_PEP_ID=MMETSP0152-20130528/6332_1 /TAXON_ID=1049557 /ORGANISM="Thalassiothrix antarctica, Strain L6-D1" /LENGTH=175 /DNA_ID=CAMNT_0038832905 /DNA_START=66 /DNA_END=593 /DNA_ORIENTATION=-
MNFFYPLFALTVLSFLEEGFLNVRGEISETTVDLGTKFFEINAYRCTKEKTRDDNAGALVLGVDFYICVESLSDALVVVEITDFIVEKGNGSFISYKPIDNGIKDSNTVVRDEGSNIAIIANRPRKFIFDDNEPIIIEGSATLAAATQRHLRPLAREVNDGGAAFDFEIQVESIN